MTQQEALKRWLIRAYWKGLKVRELEWKVEKGLSVEEAVREFERPEEENPWTCAIEQDS